MVLPSRIAAMARPPCFTASPSSSKLALLAMTMSGLLIGLHRDDERRYRAGTRRRGLQAYTRVRVPLARENERRLVVFGPYFVRINRRSVFHQRKVIQIGEIRPVFQSLRMRVDED